MRILLTLILVCGTIDTRADFETPQKLEAAKILPPTLTLGPNHQLATEVANNGLQNLYTINSEFGKFVATGNSDLKTKIHEIDALAYLSSMSKTTVFLDALKTTGINSIESIVAIFANPIQAIKALPSGVKKLLGGYARTTERGIRAILKGGDDEIDPEEFRRSNYLVSDKERNWASELKTDPYSTNSQLRSAISKMSVVQFVGGLPVAFALPVGASLTIDILGEIDDEIYKKSAAELELDNRACLAELGVPAERIDTFILAPYLTPTMQTLFCSTTSRLTNVDNTSELVEQLIASDSFNFSRFVISSIGLLTWYHETQSPLKSIVADDSLPQAITAANHYVVILPVDYLFWTESTADTITQLTTESQAISEQREFWILGHTSRLARAELEQRGWQLHVMTDALLLSE